MDKVIISLTSYPARIHLVHKVIESLFLQERAADEIVLWLSEMDFPKKNAELPVELTSIENRMGFRIKWVKENLKSHKKYFYALQEYRECIVITVDDDMCYAKTMVGILLDSYFQHPNAVSARNVHRIFRKEQKIAPYMVWGSRKAEYINMERMDMCAIGVNGILYPPGCATEKWFDIEIIHNCAENQDDLWLKYNEIRDGIPIVYTGVGEEDVIIEESQNTLLSAGNVLKGGNDCCIEKLCEHVSEDEMPLFTEWMNHLVEIAEYLEQRKKVYRLRLEGIFENYKNKSIYICGAGEYARILLRFITKFNGQNNVKGFLVSNVNKEDFIEGIEIQNIENLNEKDTFVVICGVSKKYEQELKWNIERKGHCDWLDIDIREIVDCVKLSEYIMMAD